MLTIVTKSLSLLPYSLLVVWPVVLLKSLKCVCTASPLCCLTGMVCNLCTKINIHSKVDVVLICLYKYAVI